MIHLNIGSNLDSKYGSRFKNISIAINLLINLRIKIKKISNFYETPSYPNKNFPKLGVNEIDKEKLLITKNTQLEDKKNNTRSFFLKNIDFPNLFTICLGIWDI